MGDFDKDEESWLTLRKKYQQACLDYISLDGQAIELQDRITVLERERERLRAALTLAHATLEALADTTPYPAGVHSTLTVIQHALEHNASGEES